MNLRIRPLAAGALITVIVIVAIIQIKIPYYIESNGLVKPALEWTLEKTPDGLIINTLRNNANNTIAHFSTTEFQRGDHTTFELHPTNSAQSAIQKGDTIATIYSHLEHYRLLELERELLDNQQQKLVLLSGDKPALINAAYEEMLLAESEYQTQQKLMERTQSLHEVGVVADLEYELAKNEYNIKRQQVNITKARYQSLMEGSKKEEIAMVDARLSALHKQIENLQQRLQAFTILSPINGWGLTDLNRFAENELLAHIYNRDEMTVIMPIEMSQLKYLSEGMALLLDNGLREDALTGEIKLISQKAELINQRQVVFVSSLVSDKQHRLKPNMKAKVKIVVGDISVLQYILRLVSTVYHN
jgi:multidrug efflux pump subunit AcrA (membrane-fusion protein)